MPLFSILLLSFLTTLYAQSQDTINTKDHIGAILENIHFTPLSKGTKFVSVDGSGTSCTQNKPCDLYTVVDLLIPGDIVFLKEGRYILTKRLNIHKSHSGTQEKPIIIESYPGEHAILDGNQTIKTIIQNKTSIFIMVWANHIALRKLEIIKMSKNGIMLGGSYNIIEGCKIHHNHHNGISIYDTEKFYEVPYINGYNLVENNIIYDNSDKGLTFKSYANGNNADGISILSGKFNKIIHNTVYHNSDDGIDSDRSNDTEIAYNLVYKNGLAQGDGNGIKTGGILNSKFLNGLRAYTHHNISTFNQSHGFNTNAGRDVKLIFNTAYMNLGSGFAYTANDTNVSYNIAYLNKKPIRIKENHKFNSWQKDLHMDFISKDLNNSHFLCPNNNSALENLGAYSKLFTDSNH